MTIIIRLLTLLLILLSKNVFAVSFFEKELAEERESWFFFSPEALVETAFLSKESAEAPRGNHLEINIPALRLTLYKGDAVVKQYPIAVGAMAHKTPVGRRYLSEVTWNPWWYPPTYSSWARDAKPEPPGPNNPLGPVKMSLGGDIKLHGTNKEWSVGHTASHGCIRMKNKDARELAWYFQKQFSAQNDESRLAVYAQHRGQSFPVKLSQQIPVDIIYDQVAVVEGEEIEIFPDVYGLGSNLHDQIVGELVEIGLKPWDVDTTKIEELLRSGGEKKIPVLSLVTSVL